MQISKDSIRGYLLGTAVGDSMGLPYEGLSARRRQRLFGEIRGQRFIFGRGMVSDDTEHTCMVAQSLLRSCFDPQIFQKHFAWSLRFWFLGLPAGIGRATLLACLRLWLGIPPNRSGVFSAGNGPAMRSALLGVLFAYDSKRMAEFVRASTRITHSDPLAEEGALLVANAAACFVRGEDFLDSIPSDLSKPFAEMMHALRESLKRSEPTTVFAKPLGLVKGVSGYVVHTVPVSLHAALSTHSFEQAVVSSIECGGDTDSVAAIAGALAGVRLGPAAIPPQWLERWLDLPISERFITRLADQLFAYLETQGETGNPVPFPFLFIPIRNIFFIGTVLIHLGRRALPPY